jgi:hypothetical protein
MGTVLSSALTTYYMRAVDTVAAWSFNLLGFLLPFVLDTVLHPKYRRGLTKGTSNRLFGASYD